MPSINKDMVVTNTNENSYLTSACSVLSRLNTSYNFFLPLSDLKTYCFQKKVKIPWASFHCLSLQLINLFFQL